MAEWVSCGDNICTLSCAYNVIDSTVARIDSAGREQECRAMATGGEVTGATGHQSDAVHEYTCSPCSQDHVTTAATHYCPECDVCCCKACLCDHAVLGRAKIAEWGKSTTESVGNQSEAEADSGEVTCLRHVGYEVTMYCVDHDVLCCQLCSSTDHRSCKNLLTLSAAAENGNVDEILLSIEAAISRSVRNVECLRNDSEVRKTFLKSSYTNYMKQLEEVQERVNAKFDDVREKMLVHKQHYINKFNMDQLMCNNITEELAKLKSTLEPIGEREKQFIHVKRAQELMKDKDRDIKAIYDAPVTGMFVNIPRVEEAKMLGAVADCIAVKLTEMKISVETREDEKNCDITGMCQLANGNLVLADRANTCLKQLDNDYTVISQYKLEGIPSAICATGDSEIAVVIGDKQVIMVGVGVDFETVRSFYVDVSCRHIASHNGRLFLAETVGNTSYSSNGQCYCEQRIHIHDKIGKAVAHWTTNTGGAHVYYSHGGYHPIAVSADGEKVFVRHQGSGYLVAFDSEGRQLVKSTEFLNVAGLCVGTTGYLYASNGGFIVVLSQEGTDNFKQVKSVTFSLDGASTGGSCICYDRKLDRVVICPQNSKYMYLEKQTYAN